MEAIKSIENQVSTTNPQVCQPNGNMAFRTHDGKLSTGWKTFHRSEKQEDGTYRTVERETPAFRFGDFFLVQLGNEESSPYHLFVLHTNIAGDKVTMYEYYKPVTVLEADTIALTCTTWDGSRTSESRYPYFQVRAWDGSELWAVNNSIIMSSAQREAAGIPDHIRDRQVEKAKQFRDAGSLSRKDIEKNVPPACGMITSTRFGGPTN